MVFKLMLSLIRPGYPFTQTIQENSGLWRSILVIYAAILLATSGLFEPFNDLLQLSPFPANAPEFKSYLALILAFNFGATWYIEVFCQKFE